MLSESNPKTAIMISEMGSLHMIQQKYPTLVTLQICLEELRSVYCFIIWNSSEFGTCPVLWLPDERNDPALELFYTFTYLLNSSNCNISYTIWWLAFTTNAVLFASTCKSNFFNIYHISFNPIHQHQLLHTRELWHVSISVQILRFHLEPFQLHIPNADNPSPSVNQSQNKLTKSLHAHNSYIALFTSKKYFRPLLQYYSPFSVMWPQYVTIFVSQLKFIAKMKHEFKLFSIIYLGTNVFTHFFKKHVNIHSVFEY